MLLFFILFLPLLDVYCACFKRKPPHVICLSGIKLEQIYIPSGAGGDQKQLNVIKGK